MKGRLVVVTGAQGFLGRRIVAQLTKDGHDVLAGVQRRVETMLTLVGANQFMELYPDTAAAVNSF